jgi:hypothetical protein
MSRVDKGSTGEGIFRSRRRKRKEERRESEADERSEGKERDRI